jgi:hypothetical protein
MSVRAKFTCIAKENGDTEAEGSVKLEPVTKSEDNDENNQFFKYTPWGSIEIGIVNDAAFAQFEVGKEYYVDFTPLDPNPMENMAVPQ